MIHGRYLIAREFQNRETAEHPGGAVAAEPGECGRDVEVAEVHRERGERQRQERPQPDARAERVGGRKGGCIHRGTPLVGA